MCAPNTTDTSMKSFPCFFFFDLASECETWTLCLPRVVLRADSRVRDVFGVLSYGFGKYVAHVVSNRCPPNREACL